MDLQGYLSVGDSAVIGILGYLVVFLGLVLLMIVVFILTRIMIAKSKKAVAEASAEPAPVSEPVKAAPAPGTAGDLKLYDTDPKDAAIIMAIVADSLGKPLNELRFKSIKEVKDK